MRAIQKTYRAALIGCGLMGSNIEDGLGPGRIPLPYGHAPSLHAADQIDLVAAADLDGERLNAFGERWEVKGLYRDYCEMLEREKPELVVVAGPSPLHADMVIAAAEAGVRGILCEKPLATNLRDADRMIAACDRRGTRLAVNHTRRFDPFYRKARQIVSDGGIGAPVSVVMTWRGAMMFAGTHFFDLINFFLGDPEIDWLVGDLDEDAGSVLDPGGTAYLRYQNGVHGFINADTRNAVPGQIDVIGSDGKIVMGNYDLELWKRNRESRFGELLRYPFPSSIAMEGPGAVALRELIRCVETGEESISNGRVARVALACCLAVHDSAHQGSCPIRFPYGNLDLDVPCR